MIGSIYRWVLTGEYGILYTLIFIVYAVYSYKVWKKTHNVRKAIYRVIYSVSGLVSIFLIYSIIIGSGHRGYITKALWSEARSNLSYIYASQKEYFKNNNAYAKNFRDINLTFNDLILYDFFLNDEKLLSKLNISIPKNGYIAIARAEKFGTKWIRAYNCPDTWIIGNEMPLTHIESASLCDSKSIMTFMEAVVFIFLGIIAVSFIIDRKLYSKLKKT